MVSQVANVGDIERFRYILAQQLPLLKEHYHIQTLGLFGSYVRYEQNPDSDLDILVTFSEAPSLLQFITLEHHLSLEIVGEAAKQTFLEVRGEYTSVPWRAMAGMRDKLIHRYFGVDLEVVWKTVTEDVAELIPMMQKVITQEKAKNEDQPHASTC